MSRKTRKLIWSVPLVAVLAVVGALAMFVMLAPDGAQAHEPGANTAPHQPPGPVTRIDVTTPSIADGGRTSLRVTWNAPTTGDDATMYRVDISKDTDVWMNVIGGEMSDDMLTDSEAMADCPSDDNRNRCYTATGLDSDTLYHFRVFAMNEFGPARSPWTKPSAAAGRCGLTRQRGWASLTPRTTTKTRSWCRGTRLE